MAPPKSTTTGSRNRAARFSGWQPEVTQFFDELEMDNTKSFWTAHKAFYEVSILGPMQDLLAELAPEFGEGRIFRPYRDTRFSADKSPYKTTIAAHIPAGYVSLSSDVLGVGSGLYMPSPVQLERYRAAVANQDSGPELVALVDELRRRRIGVSAHEILKDGTEGLSEGPPSDRPSPSQGSDGLEGMAGRNLAGHRHPQAEARRGPAGDGSPQDLAPLQRRLRRRPLSRPPCAPGFEREAR